MRFLVSLPQKGEKPMVRKKLEEMNLIDNFLFGSMVTDPEFGEIFSRILLKNIFGRDFGRLVVMPQLIQRVLQVERTMEV